MNRLATLLIPAMLATGCVVSAGPVLPGTVVFNWTFQAPNGGSSCIDADVQVVKITIAGITAEFACNDFVTGAGQSGTIDNVPSGVQTVSFEGLSNTYDISGNYTGQVATYGGSFTTTVPDGATDIENIVATPPTAASNSNLILLWSFAGQTCAAIGAPQVTIQITDTVNPANSVNTSVPCNQSGVDGAKVTSFAAGAYPFTLSATDSTTSTDYFASGTLYANGYSDTAAHIDLGAQTTIAPPTTGPGNVTFNFSFGAGGAGCTAGGVGTVGYYVTDATGTVIAGSQSSETCSGDPLPPVTIDGLSAPGTYFLSAQGLTGSTVAYEIIQYQFDVYPGVTVVYNVNLPQPPSGL